MDTVMASGKEVSLHNMAVLAAASNTARAHASSASGVGSPHSGAAPPASIPSPTLAPSLPAAPGSVGAGGVPADPVVPVTPHAGGGGPGSLCRGLPRYVRQPPIEAVVFAWGVNEDGQLGDRNSTADVLQPKVVDSMLGVQFSGRAFGRTPLVAGSRNTLAIDVNGQVWSWGWNDRGTLGHGHRSLEHKPKRVVGLKGVRVVQVALGGWHCMALSDTGAVFAWGGNEYCQCAVAEGQRDITTPLPVNLGLGMRVRQVSCGGMHSLALMEDGCVWQWGEAWGDFSLQADRTPRRVPRASSIAAVAAGAFHNMALTSDGHVLTWGTNDYGQLGNGTTNYCTTAMLVVDMDTVVVSDIAAGGWHSCAISSRGEVYVWGRGEYGRLGLGDRSGSSKLRPQRVRGLESHIVVQISAGGTHTMALTSGARCFVWGRGSFGRLGLPTDARDMYHPVEVQLPGGHERWRVAAVSAGGRHSVCLVVPVRETLPPDDIILGGSSDEEYDIDGCSEPSLYDRDFHYDLQIPEAPSPQLPSSPRTAAAAAAATASGAPAPPNAYAPYSHQQQQLQGQPPVNGPAHAATAFANSASIPQAPGSHGSPHAGNGSSGNHVARPGQGQGQPGPAAAPLRAASTFTEWQSTGVPSDTENESSFPAAGGVPAPVMQAAAALMQQLMAAAGTGAEARPPSVASGRGGASGNGQRLLQAPPAQVHTLQSLQGQGPGALQALQVAPKQPAAAGSSGRAGSIAGASDPDMDVSQHVVVPRQQPVSAGGDDAGELGNASSLPHSPRHDNTARVGGGPGASLGLGGSGGSGAGTIAGSAGGSRKAGAASEAVAALAGVVAGRAGSSAGSYGRSGAAGGAGGGLTRGHGSADPLPGRHSSDEGEDEEDELDELAGEGELEEEDEEDEEGQPYDGVTGLSVPGRPRSPNMPLSPRHPNVPASMQGRSSPGMAMLSGSPHRNLTVYGSPRPPSGLSGGSS